MAAAGWAANWAIEGVALDRDAARCADEAFELSTWSKLQSFSSSTTVPGESLAPNRSAICAMLGVSIIQYALM